MIRKNRLNFPDDYPFVRDARRWFSRLSGLFHHDDPDGDALIHRAFDKMVNVEGQIIRESVEIQEYIYQNEIEVEKQKSEPDSHFVNMLEIQLRVVQGRIVPSPKNNSETTKTARETGMTSGQLVLFFYYMLDALGVNFGNSDKAQWLRLMQSVSGKNYDNLKKKLNFDFDNPQTRKDMRFVRDCLMELLPSIGAKIETDSRNQD